MAPLTCPVCAAPVRQGDLICINCGANLARREAPATPQQPYPPQQDQQQGPYQPQDQHQYPPQGFPPQQDQQYPAQGQYPPQQPYPPHQGQYPPQQDQQYPPQEQPQYPPQQEQPQYPPPPQEQPQYPPQQEQPQYPPPQQSPYPPQDQQSYGQQQPFAPQQQGYGGGYGTPPGPPPGAPGAPHVPPPPREPTMTGGESTAAYTPFCPHCGAEIPDIGNPVCVQCLRPLHDQGQGGPPQQQQLMLVVQFGSGELKVSTGQELVLGRDPVQSPVASTFSRFDNVSRRHAVVGVDGGGQAWVRDERSTNGTFVNDRRLGPGEQTSLRDGDSLRLAADARGQVRLAR
jgi:hypothetical protein